MPLGSLEKFTTGISATGFILENRIVRLLQEAGWTVISNRYYEDDREGTVREIDVLAYRVEKLSEFDVYTCLIVSCKKSEKDVWAFVSRDLRKTDPNVNLWPVHTWTNLESLRYMLAIPSQGRRYHIYCEELGLREALSLPEVEVFAYQELGKANGAAHNQANIFGALTTLLKAQSYEIGSLPKRKNASARSVYQFNLLSVVDSEILRLHLKGDAIEASEIDSEHLISSYIIAGRQTFSRIRFLTAAGFERALSEYAKLRELNSVWFPKIQSEFFKDVLKDAIRIALFAAEFEHELLWRIEYRLFIGLRKEYDVKRISLHWEDTKDSANVNVNGENLDAAADAFLRADQETLANTESALKKIYRYTGAFHVTADDMPF